MSEYYPSVHIHLHGEPGHVRALAHSLRDSAGRMEQVAHKTTNVGDNVSLGSIRERAKKSIAELNGTIMASTKSIGDSADILDEWAGKMTERREQMDFLDRKMKDIESKLEQADQRLRNEHDEKRARDLKGLIKNLTNTRTETYDEARLILRLFREDAEKIGERLRREEASSPLHKKRDRFARDLLQFADDLGELLSKVGWFAPGVGRIGAKGGEKAAELLAKRVAQLLTASTGVHLGSLALADLAGAKVNGLEYVFDALAFGKGPARNYLENRFGEGSNIRDIADYAADKAIDEGSQRAQRNRPHGDSHR